VELTIKNSSINESTIVWAIIASILLHVLVAVVVPNFKFDIVKEIPQVLSIEIQKPQPPPPAPAPKIPEPEPPKPEPIKEVKPKLIPKPIPKPMDLPSPVQQVAPPPAVDKVVAIEPAPNSKPAEFVAPEPVPEPPPPPPQVNLDDAIGEYAGTLGRAIAKHKQYPRIATMRGWQGEVLLDLKIDGSGNVLSAKVRESSGHDALDNQALEMVRKASPFPAPPEALRSRSFNITVPVSFKLESP
jgi:periplasmic protein TonB